MTWGRFWSGAFALLLAVEFYAVADPATGDTLTEQVRPHLADPTVAKITLALFLGFSGWLVHHFWIER